MTTRVTQKVKLKDIALRSGVAVTTVSAALSGTGRVSDSLREKIIKVSREMNYEPNLAAKFLKQKNRTDIGLIVSDLPDRMIGSGFFQPMMVDFIQQCEQEGLKGQIEYHNIEKEDDVPKLITDGFVGGILHGGYITRGIRRWLERHQDFPFVSLEEPSEYCLISRFDAVTYRAVQHLAALGHKRVGLIVGPQEYDMHRQFTEGFTRAVNDFDLDNNRGNWIINMTMNNDLETTPGGYKLGQSLMSAAKRPTALIVASPAVSRSIIYAALKAGLDIPKDLSIITATSKSEAEQTYPMLSSITWNHHEAVSKGLHMLRNLIGGRTLLEKVNYIEPHFIVRETIDKNNE